MHRVRAGPSQGGTWGGSGAGPGRGIGSYPPGGQGSVSHSGGWLQVLVALYVGTLALSFVKEGGFLRRSCIGRSEHATVSPAS